MQAEVARALPVTRTCNRADSVSVVPTREMDGSGALSDLRDRFSNSAIVTTLRRAESTIASTICPRECAASSNMSTGAPIGATAAD